MTTFQNARHLVRDHSILEYARGNSLEVGTEIPIESP